MAKRKTKKDLEAEILDLKRDIYNLVSKNARPIDKAATKVKWKMIFEIEDSLFFGHTLMLHRPMKFDGIFNEIRQ